MDVVRDADRLRALWQDGKAGTGLWSAFDDPVVAELLATGPADYVVLDLQHGFASLATLPGLCTAMRAGGRAPLVRVPWNEPAAIMRAIDSGASGVVVPMVDDAAQAAAAVAACRYPPGGMRSWGPFWTEATGRSAGSPAEQDGAVLVVVMVETAGGLAAVEEIAATPGVGAVYVGPNDLALTTGHGRGTYRDTPAVAAMLDRVAAACAAAGTAAGLHCRDVAMGLEWASRGFGMVTVAQDTALLRAALLGVWGRSSRD